MLAKIEVADTDAAGCGFEKSGQHLHDGAFSSTIVPKQSDDLACSYCERDIIDCQLTAVIS